MSDERPGWWGSSTKLYWPDCPVIHRNQELSHYIGEWQSCWPWEETFCKWCVGAAECQQLPSPFLNSKQSFKTTIWYNLHWATSLIHHSNPWQSRECYIIARGWHSAYCIEERWAWTEALCSENKIPNYLTFKGLKEYRPLSNCPGQPAPTACGCFWCSHSVMAPSGQYHWWQQHHDRAAIAREQLRRSAVGPSTVHVRNFTSQFLVTDLTL